MYKIDPETGKQKFYAKDGTKSVISAVISILIGMIVGTLIIIIVGLTKEGISINGIWEGIKLVFFGVFSTGTGRRRSDFRIQSSQHGKSAFQSHASDNDGAFCSRSLRTGLFNIGAPGQ